MKVLQTISEGPVDFRKRQCNDKECRAIITTAEFEIPEDKYDQMIRKRAARRERLREALKSRCREEGSN
jgi:hypothetical protein